MKNDNYEHKVGGEPKRLIIPFIFMAVFGGITYWLYTAGNGVFIFVGIIFAVIVILFILSIYSCIFSKVLIGGDGFYYQTNPFNGKYYNYYEIEEARINEVKWSTDVRNISYKTVDGQTFKFQFYLNEIDAVNYFLVKINGNDSELVEEITDEP